MTRKLPEPTLAKRQEIRAPRTLHKTNLVALKDQFSIIRQIDLNHREGVKMEAREIRSHELHVRIYLTDGTWLDVTEVYSKDGGGRPIKYQYNWYFDVNDGVRWHNEPHRQPTQQTGTEPHHKHFVSKSGKGRTELFEHRSLWGVLEEIDTAIAYETYRQEEALA